MMAVNLLGKDRALSLLETVVRECAADQVEVLLLSMNQGLTRYAGNFIHQNVIQRQVSAQIRADIGNRSGFATTGRLDEASLRRAADRAVEIAKLSPGDPNHIPFPSPRPLAEVEGFDEETATYTPERRAAAVKHVTSAAEAAGLNSSGSLSTSYGELALVNSAGVRAYTGQTRATLTVIPMAEDGAGGAAGPTGASAGASGAGAGAVSGYASSAARRIADIDVAAVTARAVRKCLDARNPRAVPPGEYEVILEPAAVADLLMAVGMAFNGEWVREGRSPFQGKLGEKVCSEKVTITDDPLSPDGFPIPFDFEGQPKRTLPLMERGVVRNFVYSGYTAAREGKESTGHALPSNYRMFGAIPTNLFMATGDATIEDMIASTKRGLLITRFNYTRPVHFVKILLTGLTRDGVWYVEDGKVQYPVKNLRYTQGALEALANVEMIGRQAELSSVMWLGVASAPALKIGKFAFTGEAHM
jgi:PmbA protein